MEEVEQGEASGRLQKRARCSVGKLFGITGDDRVSGCNNACPPFDVFLIDMDKVQQDIDEVEQIIKDDSGNNEQLSVVLDRLATALRNGKHYMAHGLC